MYPRGFEYYKARSVDEALDHLDDHADADVELLAGGHSIIPAMKSGLSNPDVVVDIGNIAELRGISVRDDVLVIGAGTTYAELIRERDAQRYAPAFVSAVAQVGDRQVRNAGTIGGNLAHADPASDLPGAALASDANIVARGPDGERKIPIDEFFFGMYMTELGQNELLTAVEFEHPGDVVGAYAKKPSPSSGYAVVGVAAQLLVKDGTVAAIGVGANGALDHGVRLTAVETALRGRTLTPDSIRDAATKATEDLDAAMFMSDLQASARFRGRLLEAYTERVLAEVTDRLD